uniref:SGNH hydrolase-type esterase domain-containing protein n=1 Tax=Daucus carota subsp. sativus TaxID=79200 RepID=A0A175YKR3_DAUCS
MVGTNHRPKFVVFGSSIVQYAFHNNGWVSILADLYSRKADIVLRGYAGWNSRRALEVLDQVFPKTADVQPDLVIVYFGGNDSTRPHPSGLGPHVPIPEYIENLKKIALHVKSLSQKTRVIFLSSPPMDEALFCKLLCVGLDKLPRTNELARVYAEACVEMCKEDGIHLSPEGSKIVANEILAVLEETDWEPNLHWKSLPSEFSEDSPYDILAFDGKTTVNLCDSDFYRRNEGKPSKPET